MLEPLGATWGQVATVVVTVLGMYATLMVLIRVVGQRALAGLSGFDIGCIVAMGSVIGRTVLLDTPTLTIGVVALATLFGVQGVLGALGRFRSVDRLLNREPVLLVHDGVLLTSAMRRAHVSEDEVRQRLRLAGVRSLAEVGACTLERNGAVSVLRSGATVDAWLVADIAAATPTPQ